MTSQQEIETILLARNQRHLEQTQWEGEQSTQTLILCLCMDHGFNAMSMAALDDIQTEFNLTPELAAFFSSIKCHPTEKSLVPVVGTLTSEDVKCMFTTSQEQTSSDPRTPTYSILEMPYPKCLGC